MKPLTALFYQLFSTTGQAWLARAFVLISIVPFVGLSFYNHPSLDDYLDAITVRDIGFWQSQKHFYLTLTGRYTTTAFLALLNPLIYGRLEEHWWIMALVFVFGTLAVLYVSLANVLTLPGKPAWMGAALLLSLWLAYAPGQAEGIYWFTGAYTYILSAWLLCFWLITFSCYAQMRHVGADAKGWAALLAILTFAVAGTPEPIALPFVIALIIGAGLSARLGKGQRMWWLAGLAAVGSLVSFTAPGNLARISFMGGQFGVVKTLGYSGAATAYLLLNWVGNPVLLGISGLLLPALSRLTHQRNHILFSYLARVPAGVLAVVLAGLMVAASCPAYYASGTGLPLRARNMLYLLFLLGWFGVLLTWCCRQASKTEAASSFGMLVKGTLAPLWTGLVLLFFFADYNVQTRANMLGQGRNNVVRAYQQLLSGEAARYDAELRARYRALQATTPVVRIQPLQHRPDLLHSFDIAEAGNAGFMQSYARYFGAQKVTLDQPVR